MPCATPHHAQACTSNAQDASTPSTPPSPRAALYHGKDWGAPGGVHHTHELARAGAAPLRHSVLSLSAMPTGWRGVTADVEDQVEDQIENLLRADVVRRTSLVHTPPPSHGAGPDATRQNAWTFMC